MDWLHDDRVPDDSSRALRLLEITDDIRLPRLRYSLEERGLISALKFSTGTMESPSGSSGTLGLPFAECDARPRKIDLEINSSLTYPEDARGAAIRRALAPLPPEVQLDIREHLDPLSFAAARCIVGNKYHALYRDQLLRLLHHNPVARSRAKNNDTARATFENIMQARRNIVRAMSMRSLPHQDNSHGIKVSVAPDCCSYLTLDHDTFILQVWSISGQQIQQIIELDSVQEAGYTETNDLWFVEETANFTETLRLYTMTHPFHLIADWVLPEFDVLAISRNFVCFSGDEDRLFRIGQDYMKREIQPPISLGEVRSATISSDSENIALLHGRSLCWMRMDATLAVRATIDNVEDVDSIFFSPDGQKLAGLGQHTLRIWPSHAPDCGPVLFRFETTQSQYDRKTYPLVCCAAFSADSKLVLVVLDTPSAGNVLVVIQHAGGHLKEIHRRPCTSGVSVCTFLDDFVFVGGQCIDMSDVLHVSEEAAGNEDGV